MRGSIVLVHRVGSGPPRCRRPSEICHAMSSGLAFRYEAPANRLAQAPDHSSSITGPYVAFFGAATTLTAIRVDVLTSVLPLFWHFDDDPMMDKAAKTFGAFKSAVVGLKSAYAAEATVPRHQSPEFPYPRYYTPIEELPQPVEFTIERRLLPEKLLFQAMASGSAGTLLVKLTRRYSLPLHQLCASHGFAPAVLGYDRFPGGWIMVVMELYPHSEYIPLSLRAPPAPHSPSNLPINDLLRPKVLGILNVIHAAGFVHGDIRDTNILVQHTDGKINLKLVDFDWGGREGEVRYSMRINRHTVKRPEGAVDGELITKEHDVYMADVMLST